MEGIANSYRKFPSHFNRVFFVESKSKIWHPPDGNLYVSAVGFPTGLSWKRSTVVTKEYLLTS